MEIRVIRKLLFINHSSTINVYFLRPRLASCECLSSWDWVKDTVVKDYRHVNGGVFSAGTRH